MKIKQEHSKECTDIMQRAEQAALTYKTLWPEYCRACDGWGGHVTYGVRYYADGSGEPDSYDTCPDCIDEGICPRCANKNFYDVVTGTEAASCIACGFNLTKPEGRPERAECCCDVFERMLDFFGGEADDK